jgi:hypothetical protein
MATLHNGRPSATAMVAIQGALKCAHRSHETLWVMTPVHRNGNKSAILQTLDDTIERNDT